MDISAAKTLFSATFPQSNAVAVVHVQPAEQVKPKHSFEQSQQQPALTYSLQSLKASRLTSAIAIEKPAHSPTQTPPQNLVLEQRPSKASATYLTFAKDSALNNTHSNAVDLFV